MQLIRLNTGPSGRRGNGLFVALADWPAPLTAAADGAHVPDGDGELDFSDFELHTATGVTALRAPTRTRRHAAHRHRE